MARNYKRDRKGRFARVASSASRSRSTSRVVRKRVASSDRSRNQKRAVAAARIAAGVYVAASAYGAYTASTAPERMARSRQNFANASSASSRGLGTLRHAQRNWRGVHNITTL